MRPDRTTAPAPALAVRTLDSPLGPLRLLAGHDALVAVLFPAQPSEVGQPAVEVPRHPVLDAAARELSAYFAGVLTRFTTPLGPEGTPFQREVWRALQEIPCGELRSYADIAAAIGRPSAVRAVGAANGRNPLPIVVPCHRVIGSDGSLTGYAGGMEIKRWLLEHERRMVPFRLA